MKTEQLMVRVYNDSDQLGLNELLQDGWKVVGQPVCSNFLDLVIVVLEREIDEKSGYA